MKKAAFHRLEALMLAQMGDAAHDSQHIYRVLYLALDIASSEDGVDYDILITAALLHDIGRARQFADPALCHAVEGGQMAYEILLTEGWTEARARLVQACITAHRFRSDNPPESLEARILFDADKLDVVGAVGMARTLLYSGHENRPIYNTDDKGYPLDGTGDDLPSFFREYHYKLKQLYDRFYTRRGQQLAAQRREAAERFYQALHREVCGAYAKGAALLEKEITP